MNSNTKKRCKVQCTFCGKIYKSPSLYNRHVSYCKKKPIEKSPTPLKKETEEISIVSLNRKMNRVLDILYVQSERIKHMEKLLESRNKIIRDKLKWLTDNIDSPHCFDNCLKNLILTREHYDYITKNGYTKGYCDLVEELLDPYKEMIYSFTTNNQTYIYLNKKDKWVEFTKKHAFTIYCKIQQKLIQIALTVKLPENLYLQYNQIIYGTSNRSVDIKVKIKTMIHKNTITSIESLLNKYKK